MNGQGNKLPLNFLRGDNIVLIMALMVIVLLFSLFNSNYASGSNIINILVAASLTGLIAIGETYLIIAGMIDMSVPSVAAFASVMAAVLLQNGFGIVLTIVLAIVGGLLVGYANALLVNKIKLQAFIATLATMSIVRGFAYIICDGKPVYIMDGTFINIGKE